MVIRGHKKERTFKRNIFVSCGR